MVFSVTQKSDFSETVNWSPQVLLVHARDSKWNIMNTLQIDGTWHIFGNSITVFINIVFLISDLIISCKNDGQWDDRGKFTVCWIHLELKLDLCYLQFITFDLLVCKIVCKWFLSVVLRISTWWSFMIEFLMCYQILNISSSDLLQWWDYWNKIQYVWELDKD